MVRYNHSISNYKFSVLFRIKDYILTSLNSFIIERPGL